jgi:protein-S-isoprenylcysteine O-methyltransferase Ste14
MEQKRRIIPPVYLVLALIAMAVLHFWWPIRTLVPGPYNWLGVVLVAAGIGLALSASRLFERAGTPVVPFEQSTVLVVNGAYRYTRNPMYLGLVFILLGVWIVCGTLSPGLPVIAFVWVIQSNFIRGEERFLESIFGEQYLRYKERVRRWI